jgi:hypothetical protein
VPRIRFALLAAATLSLAGLAWAGGGAPQLLTAHGNVEKVTKDSLSIRPRTAGGQFGRTLTLKVTGTSRIATLTRQKRGGKMVAVQNDTALKDLEMKQAIAVIYADAPAGPVLLSAVALPSGR